MSDQRAGLVTLQLPCPKFPTCRLTEGHSGPHMTPWQNNVSFDWTEDD